MLIRIFDIAINKNNITSVVETEKDGAVATTIRFTGGEGLTLAGVNLDKVCEAINEGEPV